jgi:prophage regulatory protein
MIEQSSAERLGLDPFVRLRFVSATVGLSRSTIYRLINEGQFPKQTLLTERCAAWRLSEIRTWMDQRPYARPSLGGDIKYKRKLPK